MSFWSTIGNAVKDFRDSVEETSQKSQEYAIEWQNKDDDFLKKKYRNGTIAEKAAAGKLLKERGYGRQ